MIQSRTHNCNELRIGNVGERVTLVGWFENMRKVSKNLGFVILRDFYGTTQLVVETEEMMNVMDSINKESTISVEGVVRERSSKNANLPTGEIEVVPDKIEILGKCIYNALPFEINQSKDADENARLKYRYLDLRNPNMKKNIVMRSQIVAELRQRMYALNFMEITTPILTCSSPEGARDYLVPARNHPGKFYALPQAPQQFKQILMASGFDRYFQIAPCFRDEDARADRKYGSDKPDLRIDLVLTDATEVMQGCGFAAFEGQTVKAIVVDGFTATRKQIDAICAEVEVQTARKGFWFRVDENGEFVGGISKFLQDRKEEVIKALGLKNGDFVGLAAGKKLEAQKTAGVYRKLLGAASEKHMKKDCYEFCWIVDFPMYEIGEESGELEFCHNPFSMPQGGMDALNNQDPLEILAYQYDLVCNGVELSSGAVRNHDPEIMIKAFELVGLGEADVKAKFPAMYNAFCYGAPPHAGIAPGVDRMIMLICGEESIREIIPFPMNKNAMDIMMGAPGTVEQKQLDELHLAITAKPEE